MRFRVLCLLAVASFLLLNVAGVAQASVNNPPTADPNGPYTGYVGFPVTFDGRGSSDPDGDPLSYEWDFGDGSPRVSDTATPSHTYAAPNGYAVMLIVEDGRGGISVDYTTATIGNPPPVADADGPYTGTVGVPLTLDGSGSYDPDGTIILYEWDLDNDGEFDDATGVTPLVTFWSTGTYIVGLRVTDEYGDTDIDVAIVTIAEEAPVPEFPLALPVLTSLAAALYLFLRKRLGQNRE